MEDHLYRDLIEHAPFAFACLQAMRNSSGKIVDFIATDVNASFEMLTQKPKTSIVGKKFNSLISENTRNAFDWNRFFTEVIDQSKQQETTFELPERNLTVGLKAYAAEEDCLVVYLSLEPKTHPADTDHSQIKNILSAAPVGMMLSDRNGNVIDMNKPAAELFGIDCGSTASYTVHDLFDEDVQQTVSDFLHHIGTSKYANLSVPMPMTTDSSELIHTQLHASKINDDLYLYHVAEQTLSSESGNDQLYGADCITDLFVVSVDLAHRYLYANPAYRQEMANHKNCNPSPGVNFLSTIDNQALRDVLIKDLAQAMNGTSHVAYHSAPWNATQLCEYSFHPSVSTSGQTVGATFYIRTIGDFSVNPSTEHPSSEESEKLLESFFAEMKKGAAVFSVSGSGDHASDYTLQNFNAAGKQNFNAKFSALLGKRLDELIPYAEDTAILPALKSVWQNNRSAYLPPAIFHTSDQSYLLESNMFKVNTGDIVLMFQNLERDVTHADDQMSLIAQNVAEVIWLVDTRMNVTYISPSVERLFGVSAESLLGKSLLEHMSEDAFLQIKLELTKAITQLYIPSESMDSFSAECEIKNPKGFSVNAEYTARLLRDGNNAVIGVIGTTRELSQIKRLERSLRKSEETMRLLLNSTAESIFGVDMNRCITFINSMCLKMLGFSEQDDLTGKNLYNYIRLYRSNGTPYGTDDYPMNKVFSGEYIHIEKDVCVFGDRGFIPVEYYAYPQFTNDKVTGAVVTFFDISERRKQEEDIRFLNFHDVSTNLYNRNYMDRSMNMLDQSYNLPMSYLMADINGLKNVNEEFGVSQGDKHIRETAKILSGCVRSDDILARVGGDEFALLMPKTDNKTANELMEEINRNIEAYNAAVADSMQQITLSMGLSTKNYVFESMQTIIKEAENNMQQRKLLEDRSQKNTILTSMKTTLFERSQETELHAERLVTLSHALAKRMQLTKAQCNELELLAMLHDIGKISIDDNIINKPGKLSDQEWDAIKKHPEAGYRIAMATPELQPIANYILRHHERWDGKGYPGGLSGNEIPLLSRIISVVDAYDAMTQDRVYRKALPIETAIEEIMRNAGTQFDPEISRMFVSVVREVEGNSAENCE